jgi:tRNA pseudouridine65 synthase
VTGRYGHSAETHVSIKNRKHTKIGELLLLEMNPKTGRTHQLRVQCAKRKIPILGDRTYGDFSLNRKFSQSFRDSRLFLHSASIMIKIKNNFGQTIEWKVESSMPNEFSKLFD